MLKIQKPPEGEERRGGPPQEGFKDQADVLVNHRVKNTVEKIRQDVKVRTGFGGKEGERGKPPEGDEAGRKKNSVKKMPRNVETKVLHRVHLNLSGLMKKFRYI